MAFLQIVLQAFQIVYLISFSAAHVFMSGHVLHLPEVMGFQPLGNGALPDAFGTG
ncbi:MAG: hypothetical protein ACOC3T_01105 [Bacteroidota bacterium]